MTPELELIASLRETTLSPQQETIVDELEVMLNKDVLWPLPVREQAEKTFGGAIHNPRARTHKSLDRRIRHAMRVWRHRYGLNPEQMVYAGDVLAWAIRSGYADAPKEDLRFPFVYKALEKIVNDERVHDGMMRRAGLVDVRERLAELSA